MELLPILDFCAEHISESIEVSCIKLDQLVSNEKKCTAQDHDSVTSIYGVIALPCLILVEFWIGEFIHISDQFWQNFSIKHVALALKLASGRLL